jgi:hypothetical protein
MPSSARTAPYDFTAPRRDASTPSVFAIFAASSVDARQIGGAHRCTAVAAITQCA